MKLNKILLICGLCCLVFAQMSVAQVVVPPLDPTAPILSAGAAGWRPSHVFGFAYSDRTGQRKINGKQKFEYAGAVSNLTAGFKFDNSAMDFSGVSERRHTVPVAPYSQPVMLSKEVTRASLAMLGGDFVSLGLTKVGEKESSWASRDFPTLEVAREKIGGSLSIMMGSSFYVGGGFARVKQRSSLVVDNNWVETSFGAAIKTGTPGSTQFHLEYGYFGSPASKKEAVDNLGASSVPGTVTQLGTVELDLSGLLFTARGKKTVASAQVVDTLTGVSADNIITLESQAGVLWVPKMGMVLGFSFGTKQVSQIYEDSFSDFEVKLGYVF